MFSKEHTFFDSRQAKEVSTSVTVDPELPVRLSSVTHVPRSLDVDIRPDVSP